MRFFVLMPVLALAACSEGEAPKQDQPEAAPAAQLSAGQWEVTGQVANLTQRDKSPPAIKAAVGDKTTAASCVAEADTRKPPPALFVGEGYDCTYRDIYMSGGRLNATLACKHPDLKGNVAVSVNGRYTADTLEATSIIETSLFSGGDVRVETKLNGRRTGACTAPAAPATS